jgi:adenylate kinase
MKERNHKVIVITGPPLNGRDDYVREALNQKGLDGEIGYHHLFEYMQSIARNRYNINLTRGNVLEISSALLSQIRREAFREIGETVRKSKKNLDIVSTPAKFKIRPSPASPGGTINGFELNDIMLLNPSMMVIFIDDLLKVRGRLRKDSDWIRRVEPNLRTLAEWRKESIEFVYDIKQTVFRELNRNIDTIIFARAHDSSTFIDLIYGKKPRIYLSYHITNIPQKELDRTIGDVKRNLQPHFVCIDPYAIKDWDIINAYDKAVEEGTDKVVVDNEILDLIEVEEAIDEIRAQTVDRDYKLIESTHATVVCHFSDKASYGVMSEIIHSRKEANNPVYVLYPFKKRPSPFFEFYAGRENIIMGRKEELEQLYIALINKMKSDIQQGLWLKWPSTAR